MLRVMQRGVGLGVLIAAIAGLRCFSLPQADAQRPDDGRFADAKPGAGTRPIVLPATIQAFESIRLVARASGYLKVQNVDIGDRVKRGQVLAVLDVPEIAIQVDHERAAVARNQARVAVAKTRIKIAAAESEAARRAVDQAAANAASAARWTEFRARQYQRLQALFATNAINEGTLGDSKNQHLAAKDAEAAATAALAKAKSQLLAHAGKIELAEAELVEAETVVKLAQTNLAKAQVHLSFATITAPMDGIVTQRGYFPGDFVRSADGAGAVQPLFTVERTDRLRVIAKVPDASVPFIHHGDPAVVQIDRFPDKKWSTKLARLGGSLEPNTRCMTVELDLPNPTGELLPGMYGRVTIAPGKSERGEK